MFWFSMAFASPQITLAPEGEVEKPRSTVVGGYAEGNVAWRKTGPDDSYRGTATLRRFVIALYQRLPGANDTLSFTAEAEWENAIACDGCLGSVEIEQAYLEYAPHPAIGVRGGLLLIPFGIINQKHEPPTFLGVERPSTDQKIIPTTWRDLGISAFGEVGPAKWQIAATTTFDPLEIGPAGFAPGKTLGSRAPADGWAVSGRAQVEPTLGLVFGGSGYISDLAGNADFYNEEGEELDLFLPLYGAELDAEFDRFGIEARAVATGFWFPEANVLMAARREDGSPYFPDDPTGAVPSRIWGGYVEVGVEVVKRFTKSEQELLTFARLETYDTHSAVPDGFERDPTLNIQEGTFGLVWRPIRQASVKADVQLRDRQRGDDEIAWTLGLGWMY